MSFLDTVDLNDIFEICEDQNTLLAFLQAKKLVRSSRSCEKCGRWCALSMAHGVLVFRCNHRINGTQCSFHSSLYRNSWFGLKKLDVPLILKITHGFVYNAKVMDVSAYFNVSKRSVIEWYNFCREVCEHVIYKEASDCKLGGPGKIVDVDECKLSRLRGHRTFFSEDQWVVAAIERGSKEKFFYIPLNNRDADTIIGILHNRILPGTTIVADFWTSHWYLGKESFHHLMVDLDITFVEPPTENHKDTIEGIWWNTKKSLRCGRAKSHYAGYFASYIWRVRFLGPTAFSTFLDQVAFLYNPEKVFSSLPPRKMI